MAPKNRFPETAPLHEPKLRLACSFSVSNGDGNICMFHSAFEGLQGYYRDMVFFIYCIVQAVSLLHRMCYSLKADKFIFKMRKW